MQTIIPFFTPLWVANAAINMEEAVETCLSMEKTDGVSKSNVGGYQSHVMDEEEFSNVFKQLHEIIVENVNLVGYQTSSEYKFDSAWCNVNRKNNYNNSHIHPGSSISGCIYLQTPKDSGKIVFENPSPSKHYPLNSDAEGFFGMYWYEPMAGTILMFPSYLSHYVERNPTDEPRISIAFNFNRVG